LERRRVRAAGAHAREQRVALRESLEVGASRRRARGPQRGHELVQVSAPQAWLPLDQLQAVR